MTDFDTTPHPRFLKGLMNQKWTVHGALAELVDNGFGPGRGDASEVHITYDTKQRTLTVLDNGNGMEAVGHLFKLGETAGMKAGDIGAYGNGGKQALLYLAPKPRVTTLRRGHTQSAEVKWQDWINAGKCLPVSNNWEKAELGNTPHALLVKGSGTLIEFKLSSARRFQISNVQRELARMYAPAARRGRVLRWTTIGKNGGTHHLSEPPDLPNDPNRTVHIDAVVELADGKALPVTGEVGVIEGLPHSRSNVAVGFGCRVIDRTRDCYRSLDGEERYTGTGIGGWLDLGEGWQEAGYMAVTKDEIANRPAWDALMGFVFQKIQHLLKTVDEQEMWMEFEDLALQLQSQLNDGSHKVDTELFGQPDIEGDFLIGQRGEGAGRGERKDRAARPTDEGASAQQPEEKRAQIQIEPMSDREIEGVLCKAIDVGGDILAIAVNRDHPYVKAALNPPNRLAFNLLITREIAEELAHSEEYFKQAFPRRVRQIIPDSNGKGERAHAIHRLLVDRIPETEVAA